MKREGKHHGNAKSHPNKTARFIEKLPNNNSSGKIEEGAAAQAERSKSKSLHFHQRQTKPTNNGSSAASSGAAAGKCKKPRCKSCHHHPVTKSKDKAKGSYKLKSCDVALNHRLVSWRVGGGGRLDYKGASASEVLKDLAGSLYSSNYSCDDANDVQVGNYDDDVDNNKFNNFNGFSYGYYGGGGGSFNNSIDNNSTDFVEFGGLFDDREDQTVQQRMIINNTNCKTKATDNSIDQFIGFGNLFDESERDPASDFIGFGGLFDEIEPEDEPNGAEKQSDDSEEEEGDDMGFYIVGVAYEFSDGEDWLVVDEM